MIFLSEKLPFDVQFWLNFIDKNLFWGITCLRVSFQLGKNDGKNIITNNEADCSEKNKNKIKAKNSTEKSFCVDCGL